MHQPGREPAKIKPATPRIAEVSKRDQPKLAQCKDLTPRYGSPTHHLSAFSNLVQFSTSNPRLISRITSKPHCPHHRPHQTNHAQSPKHSSPSSTLLQRDKQQRSQRSAQSARTPHESLRPRMLSLREPARDHPSRIRISPRRPHSKQKTRSHNLRQTAAPSGQRCKARPPHYDSRQLIALPLAVAHHPRRNLEQRIRQHIRAQHPTPLLW